MSQERPFDTIEGGVSESLKSSGFRNIRLRQRHLVEMGFGDTLNEKRCVIQCSCRSLECNLEARVLLTDYHKIDANPKDWEVIVDGCQSPFPGVRRRFTKQVRSGYKLYHRKPPKRSKQKGKKCGLSRKVDPNWGWLGR